MKYYFYRLVVIVCLSIITTHSAYSQKDESNNNDQFGNNNIGGVDAPCNNNEGCDWGCAGVNKFDPYTGNVHREIKDLEVWGSVGEVPLVWVRYFNSRGVDFTQENSQGNWGYSFIYIMSNEKMNDEGQARIKIQYPEGGEDMFTQSANDLSLWLPQVGVGKRIFQDVHNFYLQLTNGYRYRFEKVTNENGGSYYQLQDFRDSQQNLYTLTYDGFRHLTRVTEPAGRYLEITYETINEKQLISKVTSSDGRSVEYRYLVLNDGITSWELLTHVVYGDGTIASYTYYQREPGVPFNIHYVSDPRFVGNTPVMKYEFNYDRNYSTGFIKEEINGITGKVMATLNAEENQHIVCYPNGRTETFILPSGMQGLEKEYIDGLGRVTKFTYDQDQGREGFLKTETDALGRKTTYNERTIYGNPLEITYPDGSKEKWTRDELDLVLTYTDELEHVTTYTRDERHRVTRIDYPDGTNESFTYNDFSEVLIHIRRNGGVEKNEYDDRGLRISFTDALGNVTNYTYNNASLLATVTDARGNTTRQEYNERGLLTKLINADDSFQEYKYDDFGNRTQTINELSNTGITAYDEFNRIDSMTDPLGRTNKFNYNLPGESCGCTHADNKPTETILPSGLMTEVQYDEEWEKTRETTAKGTSEEATTFYEYDMVGNIATKIDPLGKQWTYTYDDRNRRNKATDPLGNETVWIYDGAGNLLFEKRPDGGLTRNEYDNMNRLKMTTDPKGQVRKMEYDAEGNMISLTDPKNNIYGFEYDLLNRKKKTSYPNGSFESYAYDEVGNLKTYNAIAGQIKTYMYDNRNRETSSSWTSPYSGDITPTVARTYDAANRLLTLINSVSSLTYTYNEANELTSETQDVVGAGGPKTVSYSYNKDGLRKNMTYPNGSQTNYDYTSRNQIKSISNDEPTVNYTYDLNGNRTNKNLQNGTLTAYSYDGANRLLDMVNQKIAEIFAQFTYGYDNVNRRTFVKRDNDKGDVYAYDAIDQITDVMYNAADPGGTPSDAVRAVNYIWDSAGNRTMVTDNETSTSYITNNLNQYTTVGDSSARYFRNKNLRSFNGWSYKYDARNRLVNARKGSTIVVLAYDSQDRCVKRTINGITTFFNYDQWNLIEEHNSAGAELSHYIHGAEADEILKRVSDSNVVYYHQDAIGNVTHLTDTSGNVVEKYSYDIFGIPTIMTASGDTIARSAFENRFLFTGREFIQELGLYDYRNRVYSPNLGRFLQVDPIGLAEDFNLYRYVGNNPVNFNDPSGQFVHRSKAGKWVSGAAKSAGRWVGGAAKDVGGWFSGAAKDVGNFFGIEEIHIGLECRPDDNGRSECKYVFEVNPDHTFGYPDPTNTKNPDPPTTQPLVLETPGASRGKVPVTDNSNITPSYDEYNQMQEYEQPCKNY